MIKKASVDIPEMSLLSSLSKAVARIFAREGFPLSFLYSPSLIPLNISLYLPSLFLSFPSPNPARGLIWGVLLAPPGRKCIFLHLVTDAKMHLLATSSGTTFLMIRISCGMDSKVTDILSVNRLLTASYFVSNCLAKQQV